MHNPKAFAEDWVAAWNARDLDRILSHYAPHVVFLSPKAQGLLGDGRVEGLDALRAYWRLGLERLPDLHFELLDVLVGHECLTICYRNELGQAVAETMEFGPDDQVIRSFACYG